MKRICFTLESLACLPILPAELFYHSFPGETACPDPKCANSLTFKKDKNGEFMPLMLTHSFINNDSNNSSFIKDNLLKESDNPSTLIKKSDSEDKIQSEPSSFGGSNLSL